VHSRRDSQASCSSRGGIGISDDVAGWKRRRGDGFNLVLLLLLLPEHRDHHPSTAVQGGELAGGRSM